MSTAKLGIVGLLLLGACVVAGFFLWSAPADASKQDEARLDAVELRVQATERSLEETEDRLTAMLDAYSSTADKIVALEKRMKGDRLVRQCLKEVGQQAQGMSVEYGYAQPDQRLSAPCSAFVFEGLGTD